MATKYPDLFIALAQPFSATEVKTRKAPGGQQLHYITARVAMNRLDNVLGPESWWDDYTPAENSVMCRLSIRMPDGQVLTKCDAGGYAGMADQGDDDKSGFSDAFKRACAKFGVGRYLYRDGVPDYGQGELDPAGTSEALHSAEPGTNGHTTPPAPALSAPKSGKALFAKVKDLEQQHSLSLLKGVNAEGKRAGFPDRLVDWSEEQVAEAWPHILASLAKSGVRPVPESELDAYRLRLWADCKALIASGMVPGADVTNSNVMRTINRLLDAISPGERVERLRDLRDKDQLVRLIEMAEEESKAGAPKGGEG